MESNWLEQMVYSSNLIVFCPFPIVEMETSRTINIIICFILKIIFC